MDPELIDYVATHFGALMTPKEKAAERHLTTVYKLMDGRSDAAAQAEALAKGGARRRWLSTDPDVLSLAASGLAAFREGFATRVLAEQPESIYLNHCSKCGGLTRTPRAKLCLHCGFTWHHTTAG